MDAGTGCAGKAGTVSEKMSWCRSVLVLNGDGRRKLGLGRQRSNSRVGFGVAIARERKEMIAVVKFAWCQDEGEKRKQT